MHQLPTILGPAVNLGKDTTYTTLETMCNARVAPTTLEELKGRAVQTDPTVLRYASAITGQKLLPQKFDCFQALRNDSRGQKDATMLRLFGRGYKKCGVIYSQAISRVSCLMVK